MDFKETGYKSVSWINLAWDESWRRVLANMTMTTLVTTSCSVKTDRLVIGAHEQNIELNLANDQLDAQFIYFIIRLLRSSTCFEQRHARHQ